MKILILFTLSQFIYASTIRDMESTQTLSTSGAGVGSIVSVDSLQLNPASSAFVRNSSFFAGYNMSSFSDSTIKRSEDDELDGLTLAVIDSTEVASGAIMYQNYSEGAIKRNRFAINMSSPFTQKTSMGVTHFYTIDKNEITKKKIKKHQSNFGFNMVANPKTTFGIVVNDLYNTYKDQKTLGALGFAYHVSDTIQLLADAGYNYKFKLSDTLLYKFGAQLTFMDNFTARAGYKVDKFENLKGYSAGLGWTGGKLTLDIGFRDLTSNDDSLKSILSKDEKLREITSSVLINL